MLRALDCSTYCVVTVLINRGILRTAFDSVSAICGRHESRRSDDDKQTRDVDVAPCHFGLSCSCLSLRRVPHKQIAQKQQNAKQVTSRRRITINHVSHTLQPLFCVVGGVPRIPRLNYHTMQQEIKIFQRSHFWAFCEMTLFRSGYADDYEPEDRRDVRFFITITPTTGSFAICLMPFACVRMFFANSSTS